MSYNNYAISIFNKGIEAHKNCNFLVAKRSRNILKEMHRDKCISVEFLRDFDGETSNLYR